jgi:transcriptional regulator with XRE-family HTH domain
MLLGEIVKKYREDNKLTMEDFAKKSNLSKGYISMLEKSINPNTNKPIRPTITTINSIAKAISMDFNELFNLLDENHEILLTSVDSEDSISESSSIKVLAAHAIDDLTEDEQIEIIKYAKYIKSQRDEDNKK